MAQGRGIFFLTGHFGNWELLAAAHGLAGFGPERGRAAPRQSLSRGADRPDPRAKRSPRHLQARGRDEGVRAALARGECIGILLDQDAGRTGVFVPFLGHPASTSRALAVLALKTRAPVVPAFIHRLPDGDHDLVLDPEIPLAITGDLDHDILVNTAALHGGDRAARPGPSGAMVLGTSALEEPAGVTQRRVCCRPCARGGAPHGRGSPCSRGWPALSARTQSPRSPRPFVASAPRDGVGPAHNRRGIPGRGRRPPSTRSRSPSTRPLPLSSRSSRKSDRARGRQAPSSNRPSRESRRRSRPTRAGSTGRAPPWSRIAWSRSPPLSRRAARPRPALRRRRPCSVRSVEPSVSKERSWRADTAEESLEVSHPWRQRTDSAGLFAFDAVPSGDWLVVLVRVSAYDSEKLRSEPKPRQSGRGMRFLPSSSTPPREAEVWVTRVRVVAAERIGLVLTDRARWLAGPVR